MKKKLVPTTQRHEFKLESFRVRNFKAIRDSGPVKFTPLTVIIGNNGSGKSSLIEGLWTLNTIVVKGVEEAMQFWKGYEHIRHKGLQQKNVTDFEGRPRQRSLIGFELRGTFGTSRFSTLTNLATSSNLDFAYIGNEETSIDGKPWLIRLGDKVELNGEKLDRPWPDDKSLLAHPTTSFVERWQFLALVPQNMGLPKPRKRTRGETVLAEDGSNIGDYLIEIRNLSQDAFDGILETLKSVLPYARDLQPVLTSELERTIYLSLTEQDFKVPGWLLSTGTLRVLALLAVFRHPNPSPLIVIEEIENGLDPRTIHLILDEIRTATESGRSQVIITTHSPYMLDLLPLETLVLVERNENGAPVFWRPGSDDEVKKWAESFAPGQLYTAGRFKREE